MYTYIYIYRYLDCACVWLELPLETAVPTKTPALSSCTCSRFVSTRFVLPIPFADNSSADKLPCVLRACVCVFSRGYTRYVLRRVQKLV